MGYNIIHYNKKKTRYHYGKFPIGRLQFITSVGIDQTIRVHIRIIVTALLFYLMCLTIYLFIFQEN